MDRKMRFTGREGNTQVTGRVSEREARELAEAFVGPGFKPTMTKKGVWELHSADGKRHVRGPSIKPTDAGRNINPSTGQPYSNTGKQMNFETRDTDKGPYKSNVHLDVES